MRNSTDAPTGPTALRAGLARHRRRRVTLIFAACAAALLLVVCTSLLFGVRPLDAATVWQALTAPVPDDVDHMVVTQQRVPRTLIGLAAGVALGVAGVVIQGVTRNPIADPGLLGINSGASLAVVIAIGALGVSSPAGYVWFAFTGAGLAAAVVFAFGQARPVQLALVGAALVAFITPVITMILLRDQITFNSYRFWVVGALTGRDLHALAMLLPFLAVGVALAFFLAHRLNALALGDDVARGLGQDVGATRALSGLTIVALCGVAVSLVGPIALVGLVVPHAARRLVGSEYHRTTAVAVLLGPLMLLTADVIGRLVVPNSELEAGVVAAFLGAPVLVAVARGRKVAGL